MGDITKEKWSAGKTGGCVVSDIPNRHTRDNHVDYYGGHLIAESIPKQEYVNLIAAAPEMYGQLDNVRTMLDEALTYLDLADVDILIFKQMIKDIDGTLARAEGKEDQHV